MLGQFEHFAERHTIGLEQNLAGLGISDVDAEIDQDGVRRSSPFSIKDDRNGIIGEDLARDDDVSGLFRRYFEVRAPDEFATNVFGELLLDFVGCCSIEEGGNRDRAAVTIIDLSAGEMIAAAGAEQT